MKDKTFIVKTDLDRFVNSNKAELIEAIENHIEETQSSSEGADDEDYMRLNKKRNLLLKKLIKELKK